jgi:hypothetical protein
MLTIEQYEAERKLFERRNLRRDPSLSFAKKDGRYLDRKLQLRWGGWLDCVNAKATVSCEMEVIKKELMCPQVALRPCPAPPAPPPPRIQSTKTFDKWALRGVWSFMFMMIVITVLLKVTENV